MMEIGLLNVGDSCVAWAAVEILAVEPVFIPSA